MTGPVHPLALHALADRRTVLRGAVAALGAAALGACSRSGDSTAAASTAAAPDPTVASVPPTTVPPTTVPYDPSRPYWEQGNFAPVPDELEVFDLDIDGALPPSLTGLYVRNGSNPAGRSAHWFLGDGMVHGVRLERGRARWYRNRWVRTPLLGRGDILGNDDVGPPGGPVNSSNTSVVSLGGRLLSLQEVGFPYELRTDDLSTVGPFDFGGALTTAYTAHPKVDPVTGLVHSFGYGFVPPFLTVHSATPDGRLQRSEEVAVGASTMIHDFAITERDIVIWELPVVFDLQRALRRELPFRWDPSYGARIGVLPLDGPASTVRWVEIPPVYVFHGTNAFRDGDDVVVDVSVQRTMFKEGGDEGSDGLHRWRIGTGGPSLTFTDTKLTDRQIDLPTIDRRVTGRPHRYAYYVPTRDEFGGFEFGGVVRWDAVRLEATVWEPGDGVAGGEPLFVPDGPGEDDGWVLLFTYDKARDASDLVVLDASDVAAGPVARVRLPRRVPFGFHGCWVPS